jgi:hypothetical protein
MASLTALWNEAYPPSWFTGRMASLTALWNEINQPQVSPQLSLAF